MYLNLTIPRSWRECTTDQLESIASVIQEQIANQNRYRPFSMYNVKLALFFVFTGIQITKRPDTSLPVHEQYYTCRLGTSETFRLYLWQIHGWLAPKATPKTTEIDRLSCGNGCLDWLDDDRGPTIAKFPYDKWRCKIRTFFPSWKEFMGPADDLDGFSWEQYRYASDTMQSYIKLSNSLVIMQNSHKYSEEDLSKQKNSVDTARSMFLATIFNAKVAWRDPLSQRKIEGFRYESGQTEKNMPYFKNFPDTKWQVILFWWTSMTYRLSVRYPHVFKRQPVARNAKVASPLELYTATVATMQKYVRLTEEQVNSQTYSLVLEHLERMAKENEELEKVRRKK